MRTNLSMILRGEFHVLKSVQWSWLVVVHDVLNDVILRYFSAR
jgi:hypothetical protein